MDYEETISTLSPLMVVALRMAAIDGTFQLHAARVSMRTRTALRGRGLATLGGWDLTPDGIQVAQILAKRHADSLRGDQR